MHTFTISTQSISEKIKGPQDVAEFLKPLKDADQETFWLLCFNACHKIISCDMLFLGGLNSSIVDPKIVFKRALTNGAKAILIAHNHPSGNLEESPEDRNITDIIKKGCRILDITFLDHLLIAGDNHKSIH